MDNFSLVHVFNGQAIFASQLSDLNPIFPSFLEDMKGYDTDTWLEKMCTNVDNEPCFIILSFLDLLMHIEFQFHSIQHVQFPFLGNPSKKYKELDDTPHGN